MNLALASRYAGCFAGLAVGDAVGTTVEFRRRGTFAPVMDMTGGGPFGLAPGQWTDDTSMALCLAESLLRKKGFDARDQIDRYLKGWKEGYLSSTGECFDMGNTVRESLGRYAQSGDPDSGSVDPRTAGEWIDHAAGTGGAVLPSGRRAGDPVLRGEFAHTHGAPEAVECCKLLGVLLSRCLSDVSKDAISNASELALKEPKVKGIANGQYRSKGRDDIRGTGYSVDAFEAAVQCLSTTSTFEAAVFAQSDISDGG